MLPPLRRSVSQLFEPNRKGRAMVKVKLIGASGFGGTGMIELLLGHP